MLLTLLKGNYSMEQIFAQILAVLMVVFLILPFHEWAHAFTASCLGDKGVKARGRLSLNPLSHIDPIGAVMLLLIGFGWAKPQGLSPTSRILSASSRRQARKSRRTSNLLCSAS